MRNFLLLILIVLINSCISEPKKETNNSVELKYYTYAYAKIKKYVTTPSDFKGTLIQNKICCTEIITLDKEKVDRFKSELKKYYNFQLNRSYNSNEFKGLWDRDTYAPFRYEVDVTTIEIKKSLNWEELTSMKRKQCDCEEFLIRTLDE